MTSKTWKQEEKDWLRENYEKLGPVKCSQYLGRSKDAIINYANVKLKIRRREFWSKFEIEFLRNNYIERGGEYCSIALNKSLSSIYNIVKCYKISRPDNGGNKLSQNEINNRLSKTNLKLLEPYINSQVKHKFKCECGKIFKTKPDYIFIGDTKTCGNCKLRRNNIFTSHIALDLHQQLTDYGYPTTEEEHHNFKAENRRYIDIAIPKLNIAIEYDGVHFHKNTKSEDLKRCRELQKLGWKILRIRSRRKLPKISTINKRIEKLKNGSTYEVITCKDWYK